MNLPANIDLSPELRSLIEESVQNFTEQLKYGTGAFYSIIDSQSWIERYRVEVTRVIRRTKDAVIVQAVSTPKHEVVKR